MKTKPMDPHEPFLKAILGNRHDDLPRLVYADWLEETGEPANTARAHFIRTQIHLETTPKRTEMYRELKALETRILDWYLDDWRYELPEFVRYGSDVDKVKWRRGFPDDLGPMMGHQFTRSGSEVIERYPITSFQISGTIEAIDFEEYPSLRHIARLRLGPRFDTIRQWGFADDFISNTLVSLTAASVFISLKSLDLSENELTDPWLVRFTSAYPTASFAPCLESLNLSGNFRITDAGANVLATAPGLDHLQSLKLRDTSITPAGMSMLKKRFGSRVS